MSSNKKKKKVSEPIYIMKFIREGIKELEKSLSKDKKNINR